MLQLNTNMREDEIYQVSLNSTHMFLSCITENTYSFNIELAFVTILIFAFRLCSFIFRLHVYEMH